MTEDAAQEVEGEGCVNSVCVPGEGVEPLASKREAADYVSGLLQAESACVR